MSIEIEFLQFLEPLDGVPKRINVFPFISKYFLKPNDLSEKANNEGNIAKQFLLNLSEKRLIFINEGALSNICNKSWTNPIGNKRYQFWFDNMPVEVMIRPDGQEYLKEERIKNILTETSISTKKTNDALQQNIKYQIAFGIISTAAIALTAVIAVMAYYKSDSDNLILIRKSMQQQVRVLDSFRLSQKANSTYLTSKAKKTSPKKK
ncbi:MAG: hypothetical protein ACTHJ8_17940 [Mucilaginibacter sp.]